MLHLMKELEIQKRLTVETEVAEGHEAAWMERLEDEAATNAEGLNLTELIIKYAGKKTGPEIAAMTGYKRGVIHARAGSLGISLKMPNKDLINDDIAKAIKANAGKLTGVVIARNLGVAHSTVKKRAQGLGISLKLGV